MKKLFLLSIIMLFSLTFVSAVWDSGLDNGLIHWYTFNESSGTLKDGNGSLDLTDVNTPTYSQAGKIGTSIYFDNASSEYFTSASYTNPAGTGLSYACWIYPAVATNNGYKQIIGIKTTDNDEFSIVARQDMGGLAVFTYDGTWYQDTRDTTARSANTWYHVVATYDFSNASTSLYINGAIVDTAAAAASFSTSGGTLRIGFSPAGYNPYGGRIDECQMWSRPLTSSEVSQIYDGGDGINPLNTSTVTLTNVTPADGSLSLAGNVIFNATASSNSVNLTNATIYIDGSLNETKSITGLTNYTSFNISLGVGNYTWFITACDTSGNCDTSSNHTLEQTNFITQAQSYTTPISELTSTPIILNISAANALTNGYLWYNGTRYTGSITTYGSNLYGVNYTIATPTVEASTNYTFFWQVQTATEETNTTTQTQVVQPVQIDNCSNFTNGLFNLYLVDEENQTAININNSGFINVYLNVYSSSSGTTLVTSYSNSFVDVNNASICIDDDLSSSTYYVTAKFQYGADSYRTEQYNLELEQISNANIPMNITLYDILTANSEAFEIIFKNGFFQLVEGALVTISREYVGEGLFKSVEIPITDSNGRAIASLSPEDTTYTIYVTKDGVQLASFENVVAKCQNQLTGECTISLNSVSSTTTPQNYAQLEGLSLQVNYDVATKTLSSNYVTYSGEVSTVNMSAYLYNVYLNDSACSEQVSSSSGTLSCVISNSYDNKTLLVQVTADGEVIYESLLFLSPSPIEAFGVDGIILGLIILMTIPLMFVGSAVLTIIGGLIGMLFASILIFTTGGALGIGVSMVWLLVAGGVLIWRMTRGVKE